MKLFLFLTSFLMNFTGYPSLCQSDQRTNSWFSILSIEVLFWSFFICVYGPIYLYSTFYFHDFYFFIFFSSIFYKCHQFSWVTHLCLTLCDPMNCSTPGLPVHHQLPEFTQTHVHWVSDAIQPSHPLSSPSPPALKLSQHQGLFKWVSSLHQVAKVLEFQLQHQSFQWTPRTDLL